MRLDREIVARLVAEIRDVYGSDAGLWLFGPRTDDSAKGGDIDLYVETDAENNPLDRYLDCRRRLYRLFGDQKIDLLVRSRSHEASPIERIALKTGIKLSDNINL